jgi:glucose/arabinose dehydrogenase
MVEFVMIPGSGEQEAVVVSQHEAVISRVSLTGVFGASEYGNLSGKVKTGNEEGLLSLAFSPNFTADGRVYVYYTSTSCAPSVNRCVRVSRFQVVNNNMDETGEVVVLEVNQQLNAINHNGGRILFGPDGKLYISIGDGGGGGDPLETGQNKDDLLGNILRIDVTGQTTYIVPSDNPFVNADGADEVWAYGLRNPWRYSFDRATGLLWLGDVGQDAWEEVDVIEKGGNYGWDCFEGTAAFEPGCASNCCHAPRAVYAVAGGECAITGGYVYRGTAMPELSGRYIYGDFCSGKIWAFDSGNPTPTPVLLLDSDKQISSFAELLNGELLLLTFQNAIFRLTR